MWLQHNKMLEKKKSRSSVVYETICPFSCYFTFPESLHQCSACSSSGSLTQLCGLSVEGAADRSAMQGQPGETVMAHRVTAEQQAWDLVSLEGEDVLTHATLQHLQEAKQK